MSQSAFHLQQSICESHIIPTSDLHQLSRDACEALNSLLGLMRQASSSGESMSTLSFGARVAEITLGQAKACTESSAVFEAREGMRRCALERYLIQRSPVTAESAMLQNNGHILNLHVL